MVVCEFSLTEIKTNEKYFLNGVFHITLKLHRLSFLCFHLGIQFVIN